MLSAAALNLVLAAATVMATPMVGLGGYPAEQTQPGGRLCCKGISYTAGDLAYGPNMLLENHGVDATTLEGPVGLNCQPYEEAAVEVVGGKACPVLELECDNVYGNGAVAAPCSYTPTYASAPVPLTRREITRQQLEDDELTGMIASCIGHGLDPTSYLEEKHELEAAVADNNDRCEDSNVEYVYVDAPDPDTAQHETVYTDADPFPEISYINTRNIHRRDPKNGWLANMFGGGSGASNGDSTSGSGSSDSVGSSSADWDSSGSGRGSNGGNGRGWGMGDGADDEDGVEFKPSGPNWRNGAGSSGSGSGNSGKHSGGGSSGWSGFDDE